MPGISMSRKITSGLWDPSARMASTPSSASATTSNSGQSAANPSFSSPRRSGSSSATTAVGRAMGNLHYNLRAAAARGLECKSRIVAVQRVQAILDDVQFVAAGVQGEGLTTISDLDAQLACCAVRGKGKGPRATGRPETLRQ